MKLPSLPLILLFLGLAVILLILCGVLAWTTRISFRLNKVDAPKTKPLFAIAFLQILAGVIAVFVVRTIKNDPLIALGASLVIMLVSGIFLMELILKMGWKQSLRIWGIAAAVQLVLAPVCSAVMAITWAMILFWLFPPQY